MQSISINLFKFVQTNGVRFGSRLRALPSSLLEIIRFLGRLLPSSTLVRFSIGVGIAVGVYYAIKLFRGSIQLKKHEEAKEPARMAPTQFRESVHLKRSEELEGPLRIDSSEFLRRFRSGTLPNQPIFVTDSLEVDTSYDLAKLPKNLTVESNLTISFSSLRALPEGLRVGGNLDLSRCGRLESIPESLYVGRDLNLKYCVCLTKLPAGLWIGRDLILFGCRSLRELPAGLHVNKYLTLIDCTSLIALPEGLIVGKDLDLTRCRSLRALPSGMQVGGNFHLDGCTSLTSLPNNITHWGPTASGQIREVDLTNTGLSDALIDRLRTTEAPGMRFQVSRQATPVANEFATLVHAVNFWSALLPQERLTLISLNLRCDQEPELIRFLTRLKATAEYQNILARPVLAKRIYDVLKEMQQNNEFKETASLIIHEGLSTCHDRIISALDELDLMMQIKKAEEKGEREELRKLGRGMLMLEEVQKAAEAHALTLTWVDEIEIRLAFQIGLRDRLQLPLSTGHMIFRGCAQVSDEQIQEVGIEIERRITDTKVEAYLQTWSPWQKLFRREALDTLEPEVVQAPEDLEWVCCVGTEELRAGYLYGRRLYAPETLRKIYIEKGIDPFTNLSIDRVLVKKVIRGVSS